MWRKLNANEKPANIRSNADCAWNRVVVREVGGWWEAFCGGMVFVNDADNSPAGAARVAVMHWVMGE